MPQTTTKRGGEDGNPRNEPIEVQFPAELQQQLDGQLTGQKVVAWSEYDLDEANRYARRFVVLTEQNVVLFEGGEPRAIAISSIEEAKIRDGLGLDRMTIISAGKPAAELRYTRRCRRDMLRVHRKLERRLPKKDPNAEMPPDWLEIVEREAEKQDRCVKCGLMIPSYAEGVCPRCLHKRRILWRLLDAAKPYRVRLRLALILTLVISAMATLPAVFNRYLIDDGVRAGKMGPLVFWCSMLLAVTLVSETLGGLRMRQLAMLGCWITRDLRHAVYAHLHELSLRFFGKRRTGSLITRVTNDTDRLWDFIVFGSVDLIRDIAMITFIAAVMFWMNWRLAIVALLPLPLLGFLTYKRGKLMQKLWGRLWTYWSRMTAVVGDAVPGVRVVKAFANEQREIRRFDDRSDEVASKEAEIHVIWTKLQPVVSGLMRLGALLIWIVGGYIVIKYPETKGADGRIENPGNTVGMLIAFTQFIWQFYQPIMELANSNRMVTRAASSAQRVFEVLDTPPDIYSKTGALKKERLEGRVEFRQVSFSYEGAEPALREVSLLVEPGQMVGLCGPSGAGKSTLVNLICRFYDATDGQILLDGVDIRDFDVQWLRRQIGVVLQEPYLFHGTVADNIRYGNPDATMEQVIAAARAANAHDFVVGFPDGYDSLVGERGQSLSGGERQRISIARAILHNPRILILDEATSSVDTETEKQIQQALDHLVEGRTTIAIAHRLSTLQAADKLVVLEKGKMAEQGTHAELVNKEGGVYAKLHKTQVEMSSLVAIAG